MTTRRSGFRQRSVGFRRTTDWGLGPQNLGTTISASGKQLWSFSTASAQNLTVVRTRGWISYYLRSADVATAGFRGASGIYLMTEDAFAVGVTAALDPLEDSNSDMWLWHFFFDLRAITGTLPDLGSAAVVRQEIDSKAMRKGFDPERVMVGVTGVVETVSASMSAFADTRQFFKQG